MPLESCVVPFHYYNAYYYISTQTEEAAAGVEQLVFAFCVLVDVRSLL